MTTWISAGALAVSIITALVVATWRLALMIGKVEEKVDRNTRDIKKMDAKLDRLKPPG